MFCRVEDNGLEQEAKTLCSSDRPPSAAQNPARFDAQTMELLTAWQGLSQLQRNELLEVAIAISVRQRT